MAIVSGSEGDPLAISDISNLGLLRSPFLEFLPDHSGRQASGVNRHPNLLQQVGNRSDVILVAVSDDERPQLLLIRQDVGKVGNQQRVLRQALVLRRGTAN